MQSGMMAIPSHLNGSAYDKLNPVVFLPGLGWSLAIVV
jgi:hypothetical protein